MKRPIVSSTLLAMILGLASACTSTGGTSGDSEPAASDEPAAETPPAPAAPVEGEKAPPTEPVPLGQLENEDMRHIIWSALERRVTKSASVSGDAEETTELGDYDSFKFTVVRVLSGKDDISGDSTQAPDGVEVEVTGWYKRTLKQSGQEPQTSCFSFDATTPVTRRGGDWVVPDSYKVAFGREDQEDCY